MTRLEQAIRWWKNHQIDECNVPGRHFHALLKARLIGITVDDEEYTVLTARGKRVLEEKG